MNLGRLPPVHSGKILREGLLAPRGRARNALARASAVPPRRIDDIMPEKRGITADTVLRPARRDAAAGIVAHLGPASLALPVA